MFRVLHEFVNPHLEPMFPCREHKRFHLGEIVVLASGRRNGGLQGVPRGEQAVPVGQDAQVVLVVVVIAVAAPRAVGGPRSTQKHRIQNDDLVPRNKDVQPAGRKEGIL